LRDMSISVCKFSYLHGNGRFLKSVFAPSLFSLPLVVGSCSLLSSFVRSSSKEREREKRNVSAHHHQRRQQGKQKEREERSRSKKEKLFTSHDTKKQIAPSQLLPVEAAARPAEALPSSLNSRPSCFLFLFITTRCCVSSGGD